MEPNKELEKVIEKKFLTPSKFAMEIETIVANEEMKLPVNCMKGESVVVTFSYNANQTMDCEFVHEKSGTKVSRQISMNSSD